jgi:hypothetical protein
MEKKSQQKSRSMSTRNKVMIGAGLTALGAAAAGAVFLYGTEAGKKRRKQVRSWMLNMRADVLDEMERMKDWSEQAYSSAIDNVAKRYKNLKNVDPVEIAALVRDLKGHWRTIKRQTEAGGTRKKKSTTKK